MYMQQGIIVERHQWHTYERVALVLATNVAVSAGSAWFVSNVTKLGVYSPLHAIALSVLAVAVSICAFILAQGRRQPNMNIFASYVVSNVLICIFTPVLFPAFPILLIINELALNFIFPPDRNWTIMNYAGVGDYVGSTGEGA